jgi:vesicle-associated membrane protein 7
METFNEKISNQKIDMIQKEINNVKGIMVQNIDKVLARGEKIELLVDKSEQLDQKAFIFKKEATKVKKIMWWNNCKFWLLLFIVLGVIALIIYVIACGGFDCSKK